jgi:hypothetical protein
MVKIKDLAGQSFGRLTAIEVAGSNKRGSACWRCVCTCGSEVVVRGADLTDGNTKSCGCLMREIAAASNTTHGMRRSRLYRIWQQMKQRCKNPSHKRFSGYGGRGIKYDPSWEGFENFLADMGGGYEEHLSLDRIDNNRGYSKENCRWTTASVQNTNKRKRPGCKSEYIGVSVLENGTFRASRSFNGKKQHLGVYKTATEAAIAYDDKCEEFSCGRPNGTTKDA